MRLSDSPNDSRNHSQALGQIPSSHHVPSQPQMLAVAESESPILRHGQTSRVKSIENPALLIRQTMRTIQCDQFSESHQPARLIIDWFSDGQCFHFMEQPKGLVSRTSGALPESIESKAFRRSLDFTREEFRLSSIRPLYCKTCFSSKANT